MLVSIEHQSQLSYQLYGEPSSCEPVVFLHGIMGNKSNLSGFVKRFIAGANDCAAIVFDLPNHGESSKGMVPTTVAACGDAIAQACQKLQLRPRKIVGHSFGGKVAVMAACAMSSVEQVWLLDCPPGVIQSKKPFHDQKSPTILEIITILRDLNWPVASRKELVNRLEKQGISKRIAAFMTTNLVPCEGGLCLKFDPQEILAMLKDFAQLDCWPILEKLKGRVQPFVLAAEFGSRVSSRDQDQLLLLTNNPQSFHWLKESGHFVHIDSPREIIEIIRNNDVNIQS